jgi:hypothetical protein
MGDSLHLIVDDASRRAAELQSRLTVAGVPFEEIIQVTPTVEDLFVNAIAGKSDQREK